MTTPIDGNDPAFPRATTMNPVTGQPWNDEQPGVPIRALLAGMALSGIMANPSNNEQRYDKDAELARLAADALIAELNQTTEEVDGPSAGQCDEILGHPHYNAK